MADIQTISSGPVSAAHKAGKVYAAALSILLPGYALLGRGFAHIGFAPVYLGEITLALGCIALVLNWQPEALAHFWPGRFLIAFMIWGAVCTLPHIATYKADALRDAVVWGYGLFAVCTACVLINQPALFKLLFIRYRRFIIIFICCAWLIFLIKRIGGIDIRFMGAPAGLGTAKGGDILVHLSGAIAFLLVGMAGMQWWVLLLIAVNFLVVGITNRSGIVACALSVGAVFIMRPVRIKVGPFIYGVLVAITALALINPKITLHNRTLSIDQLILNIQSIVDESGTSLDKTKKWRLNWWSDIIGYTFGGKYFWTGKGYGVNLADDDGYQVTGDRSLRNPHNGHLTVLARSGVPGFALWLCVQLSWAWALFRSYLSSKRNGDSQWAAIFVFLIAYWTAFMANAAFDVFIEGPMGGIWFWSLFGTGLAAVYLYRWYPDIIRS